MRENNYRGKRAQFAIDDFMIVNQDLLMLNEEEIEEILEPLLKKDYVKESNNYDDYSLH